MRDRAFLRLVVLIFGVHEMSIPLQDGPPTGGYAPFRYARDFGRKNPSGAVLYLGMAAIMTFGFYRVAQGNLERRYSFLPKLLHSHFVCYSELKEEKKRARQNIIPFLQADDDIR